MSLILDALKRAQRERPAGGAGTLEDLPGGASPRRRRWGRWLALAVLAVVVIAVAVSVARRPKRPARVAAPATAPLQQVPQQAQRPAPPVAAAPTTPQPATPTPSAPAPIQARPAPSVIPGTEGVSSLDELTPDADVELEPAPEPAPRQPATAAAERQPRAPAPAEPQVAEAQPDEEAEAEPPAPHAAEPSRPAVPPALTQKAPVRKLREMPPDYRADFPALTIEVHVFEPNRRFVMINGRRYKEGERLAEGPQLVEIVRDGVVLEYRGEKVLYPLGR